MKPSASTLTSEGRRERLISRWIYAGFWSLMFLGSLLHFVFEFSQNSLWVAAFVPVNESVWEHLKLGYTALWIFSLVEYPRIRRYVNNYWIAKFNGVAFMSLIILFGFELYTMFTHHNIFWIDISLFFIGGLVCQHSSSKHYKDSVSSLTRQKLSLAGFIGMGVVMAWFTWHPPHHSWFMDRHTRTYGIPFANHPGE